MFSFRSVKRKASKSTSFCLYCIIDYMLDFYSIVGMFKGKMKISYRCKYNFLKMSDINYSFRDINDELRFKCIFYT